MKHILVRALVYLLAIFFLTACGSGKAELSSGPITGQILEAHTKKPIAGAIVLVRWKLLLMHGTSCYRAETATTNATGRFQTPAWETPNPSGFRLGSAEIDPIYKVGYESSRPPGFERTQDYKQNIYHIAPFKGTSEERLQYLGRLHTSCNAQNESEKNRLPLLKEIYEEAKRIAKTDYEKYVAASFEYEVDSLLAPLGKGASLSYPHREKSELLKAIEGKNILKVKVLLDSGADPNDRDNDGATMLMKAISYGHSDIAMLLLENGANPNAVIFEDRKYTAMQYLLIRNIDYGIASADEIAALMIRKGFNINQRDLWGNTTLLKITSQNGLDKNKKIINVLELAGIW